MKQPSPEIPVAGEVNHHPNQRNRRRWAILITATVCLVLVSVWGWDNFSAARLLKKPEPGITTQSNRISSTPDRGVKTSLKIESTSQSGEPEVLPAEAVEIDRTMCRDTDKPENIDKDTSAEIQATHEISRLPAKHEKRAKLKNKSRLNAGAQDRVATVSATPFYRKAFQLHQKKQFDQAIQMYRQLLNKYPKDYRTRFNLAAAFIETGQYNEARDLFYELHQEKPEDKAAVLNLAIAEIGLDRLQEAIEHLEKMAEADGPLTFEIQLYLGVANSRIGKLEEAIAWYEKAEKCYPGNPRLLFNMGLAFDKQQQYQKALMYYSRYLQQKGSTRDSRYQQVSERVKAVRRQVQSNENQRKLIGQ